MNRLLFILATIILVMFFGPCSTLRAQITVDNTDLPSVGDTFRISVAAGTGGVDPALTGANYAWDYTNLSSLSQSLDTFIDVGTTPAVYQLVFNNFLDPQRANLATSDNVLDFIPGFEIGDVYQYYRNDASGFSFLGFAGSYSGIPVPVKYDDPDRWFAFPMAYGNEDSTDVEFQFSIPGIGAILSQRKRVNEVDGWGTVQTPYGTFPALRHKSVVSEFDSVYVDSLGQGIGLNRNFTEYRWIAKGIGWPLLQITVEGLLTTVTYLDSLQSSSSGYDEPGSLAGIVEFWPIPCKNEASLRFFADHPGEAAISILDMQGRVVMKWGSNIRMGENQISLDQQLPGLEKGCYLLNIHAQEKSWTSRFVKL